MNEMNKRCTKPRAKFRVMDTTRSTNGNPFDQSAWRTQSRMLPIKAFPNYHKDGDPEMDPDFANENAAFWSATPSGDACWFGEDAELGRAYYIDMAPTMGGEWKLEEYSHREAYVLARLCKMRKYDHPNDKEFRSGEYVEVGINTEEASEGAWKPFVDAGPGSRWNVTFTPAPG
jgi:hypothetical protein